MTLSNLTFLILTFVVAGAGAYFGAYFRQKGKNLATHEDIDKLVAQVAAVTQTTKEIEAKISNEMWDRQQRWELKRNVLLETAKRVAAVDDALGYLSVVYHTALNNPSHDYGAERVERNTKWFKAIGELEESELFVGMTCGKNVEDAIENFRKLVVSVAAKINKNDGEIYRVSFSQRVDLKNAIREAIRKELGINNDEAKT